MATTPGCATKSPDGKLVAYWQQSIGAANDIYSTTLGAGGWAGAAKLTASTDIESAPSLAVDTDGSFALVHEAQTVALPAVQVPGLPETPPLPTTPNLTGTPINLGTGPGVGTNLLQSRPELSFSRPLAFPYQDKAAIGSQTIGEATLVNTGLAGDNVRIDYISITGGVETVIGTQTIFLAPGSTFDIAHAFPVKQGSADYAVRVTALGGGELTSTADNLSSATLIGLPDIAVGAVTLSNPSPAAGQTVNVSAEIKNLSSSAIGNFTVKLYAEDPKATNPVQILIGTATVNLAANGSKVVTLPWTLPATGGSYVVTAVADAAGAIEEATEFNNTGTTIVTIKPDAAAEPRSEGDAALQVHIINFTGVNNVQLTGAVRNRGKAPLVNVPVQIPLELERRGLPGRRLRRHPIHHPRSPRRRHLHRPRLGRPQPLPPAGGPREQGPRRRPLQQRRRRRPRHQRPGRPARQGLHAQRHAGPGCTPDSHQPPLQPGH